MPFRCKLVFKKDMYGKLKKGDVVTFITQTNCINPTLEQLSKAVAAYIGEADWKNPMIRNMAQPSNYDMSYEFIR